MWIDLRVAILVGAPTSLHVVYFFVFVSRRPTWFVAVCDILIMIINCKSYQLDRQVVCVCVIQAVSK